MDPVAITGQVEEQYRRYLETTFYFRDPEFRSSFEAALKSWHLTKGPYLEGTPVFKQGGTPRSLFAELLEGQVEESLLNAVHADRPLYLHQEQAIRTAANGRNVIVATGTGSGKTEAFLYPILLHLYREHQAGTLGSGVRALVLYPMNALANDQRARLGEIAKRLKEAGSYFRFTFGQYIGETPEDRGDSRRYANDHIAHRLPGELVLRTEMRESPSHILLTNYSMLEYLLLRPTDSPLFDEGMARWWTFLVLDEAHQYRGSRGTEMAMLIRRLKRRLREGGRTGSFRCVATSATLVGGDNDRAPVAKFASDLFGEPFSDSDVVLGEVQPIPEPSTLDIAPDDYPLLGQILEGTVPTSTARHMATRLGIPLPDDLAPPELVGSLLQYDARTARLRRLVTQRPVEINHVADAIFDGLPGERKPAALSALVQLLLRSHDPLTDTPLLSARFHFFLRSLEGAFIAFSPERKVLLDRHSCGQDSAAFEVALCRECGQHYLVGKVVGNRLVEATRDPGHPDFGVTFFRPIDAIEDDEDPEDDRKPQLQRLCVRCGEVRRLGDPFRCTHNQAILVERHDGAEGKEDQIGKCAACGYSPGDPVRELVHGTDGPHAVIATKLYQELPQGRKKVLAFADGRQEAAFFAWYLEASYKDILSRNLLFRVARDLSPHAPDGLSLSDLATGLRNALRKSNAVAESMGDLELRNEAWLRVYREFLTDEPRLSLEGVGLVRWSLRWPSRFKVPSLLLSPPWSLSEQEARDLCWILLDSLRGDRAVEIAAENGVGFNWADIGLRGSQTRVRTGPPRRPKGAKGWPVQSWDGKTGRRHWLLRKILAAKGLSEGLAVDEAARTLRAIWDAVRDCDESARTPHERLLVQLDDGMRINPAWWRLGATVPADIVYKCDTCGRHYGVSVAACCPRFRCPGTLTPVPLVTLAHNHYRSLYAQTLPASLRVEEHTAQLEHEKARQFQKDFRDGRIQILSCSTTFELGVDLGDLDTVFLRNVPPEAFNYAQRVGRSGRRSGHPGLALTFCRRGPHDLYHFSEPGRMLSGTVNPPVVSLRNKKIVARHVVAAALSAFFRHCPDRFGHVRSRFGDLEAPSGSAEFKDFLALQRSELEDSLRSIVPADLATPIGLDSGAWIEEIAGEESRFGVAESEVSSDFRNVREYEEASVKQRDYDKARWAELRAKTIAEEDTLSFLSRKAVIPKYGFPVDVVELDTQRAQQNQDAFQVSLQRDLSIAISEFAPTSELIANKKLWTSYGLKKVLDREWPRMSYKKCRQHDVFVRWEPGQPEPPMPCGDDEVASEYIVPRFGFTTSRDKPKEPQRRPSRMFTTRPYFAGLLDTQVATLRVPFGYPTITMTKSSPGLMAVLCEGRRREGFYVCGRCGAGFRHRVSGHKTPYGEPCSGTLENVSLGHEFQTDVVRLQFPRDPSVGVDPVWFAYSLAYALVEGTAETLEVPSDDLSAVVSYDSDEIGVAPIVIYDNVPGGAGLVARLEDEGILRRCLESALKRVSGSCGCDESTSCYGCIRSYRNQFAHENLRRGPVRQYLDNLLADWA